MSLVFSCPAVASQPWQDLHNLSLVTPPASSITTCLTQLHPLTFLPDHWTEQAFARLKAFHGVCLLPRMLFLQYLRLPEIEWHDVPGASLSPFFISEPEISIYGLLFSHALFLPLSPLGIAWIRIWVLTHLDNGCWFLPEPSSTSLSPALPASYYSPCLFSLSFVSRFFLLIWHPKLLLHLCFQDFLQLLFIHLKLFAWHYWLWKQSLVIIFKKHTHSNKMEL